MLRIAINIYFPEQGSVDPVYIPKMDVVGQRSRWDGLFKCIALIADFYDKSDASRTAAVLENFPSPLETFSLSPSLNITMHLKRASIPMLFCNIREGLQ